MQIDLEPHDETQQKEPFFGSNAGNFLLHFVIGIILTWLFFEPIKNYVSGIVRPLLQ